jgi:hypothetical protein
MFQLKSSSFEKIYRDCWRRNGDALSLLYAGTGSTIQMPNENERLSEIKEKFNSQFRNVHRFYKSVFDD